jgi:hypothetical protein
VSVYLNLAFWVFVGACLLVIAVSIAVNAVTTHVNLSSITHDPLDPIESYTVELVDRPFPWFTERRRTFSGKAAVWRAIADGKRAPERVERVLTDAAWLHRRVMGGTEVGGAGR